MFLSRNKKNNVNPCKPQFYCIKVGFKGSKLYRYVFMMTTIFLWEGVNVDSVQKGMYFTFENIFAVNPLNGINKM